MLLVRSSWEGETVSTEAIKRDLQLFHHDWSLDISSQTCFITGIWDDELSQKQKVSHENKSWGVPANKNRPPPDRCKHYIYIYIYNIYIKHLDISHVAKPVPRDGFQLVSLDNLSISSDEIELVKAVYRQTGSIQKNVQKNQKRTIRRKASHFEVADGELYLKKMKKYEKVNIVWYVSYWYCVCQFSRRWSWDIMNKDEQTKILKACHVDATVGHMGIKKTVSKITAFHVAWSNKRC